MMKTMNKTQQLPHLILMILILSCLMSSCKNEKDKAIETIATLKGQTVIIPKDTIFKKLNDTKITSFAIIEYIDSSSCVSCSFNMEKWEDIIKQYDSIKPGIKYFFILNSKPTKNIIYTMRWDHFMHPVVFDNKGLFGKANDLPKRREYHTLLIDRKYHIVAIGRPTENSEIDELYKRIIAE